MRTPKNMKSAIDAIAVAMTISALASCSESPRWEFTNVGVHQVRVDELFMPDTIASDEVLPIQLSGSSQFYGQECLSRIDAVRESTEIELTVWAEVEVWTGSGPAPPFAIGIWHTYEAQPPFDAGDFRVVINQPDGSQLVESVLIEP